MIWSHPRTAVLGKRYAERDPKDKEPVGSLFAEVACQARCSEIVFWAFLEFPIAHFLRGEETLAVCDELGTVRLFR